MSVRATRTRTFEPADSARTLRKEKYNGPDGRMRLPVNPIIIARNLGIKVLQGKMDRNIAGFILKEASDSAPTIYLNETNTTDRKRFTLAHELGHYVKNEDGAEIAYVDYRNELSKGGTDQIERWCKEFAAELLMPKAVIMKCWAQGMKERELRRILDVSKKVMDVRMRSLGLK